MLWGGLVEAQTYFLDKNLDYRFLFIFDVLFDGNMLADKVVMGLQKWFWLEFFLIFRLCMFGLLWLNKLLRFYGFREFLKLFNRIVKIQ